MMNNLSTYQTEYDWNAEAYYANKTAYLTQIYRRINPYLTIFILVPGWFLNLFLSSLFWRHKFWIKSTLGYFYTVYPLISNGVISIGIVNFYPEAYGVDLTLVSVDLCKLIWWLRSFFLTFSILFQVQMSVDRALGIVMPRHFNCLTKVTNHVKITAGIFLFSFAYPSVHFTRKIFYSNSSNHAVPTECTFPTDALVSFFSFSFFLIRSVSLLSMFVSNLLILRKLVQSKNNVAKITNHKLHHTHKEWSFAFSLMVSNFIQLVLNLPFLVVLIIMLYESTKPNELVAESLYISILYGLTNWGNYIYEALAFPINLFGNRIIRAEVKSLICHHVGLHVEPISIIFTSRISPTTTIFHKNQSMFFKAEEKV